MSKIEYCQRGGQEGIRISDDELQELAQAVGSDSLDEFIPLPHTTIERQKEIILNCKSHNTTQGESEYWERDDGSHGWCCSNCGTVTQWG